MKYFLTIILFSFCFSSNAQEFLKAEITTSDQTKYDISLALNANFYNPITRKNEEVKISVIGTSEGTRFISEDVVNFFTSAVIIEELQIIAGVMQSELASYIYLTKMEPGSPYLEFRLTLKPDRIVVKSNRMGGGNLPDIPVKEFHYSKYMR